MRKNAWVSVYGFGKVGSAIGAWLLKKGFRVIGVDVNEEWVEALNSGDFSVDEPGVTSLLKRGLKEGRFYATTDGVEASRKSRVKITIVPVDVDSKGEPDFSALADACIKIACGLKKGDLVVTETTLPPGTTKNFVAPLIEAESKLKVGKDFFLAHAPERVYVGRILKDFKRYKKIVGGVDEVSGRVAKRFYEKLFPKGVILMDDSTAAEAAKVFGITYRYVNIALANELKMFCDKLGIDFWKVREATNAIKFFNLHSPGIPGGHCVPVYPHFLLFVDKRLRLVKASVEINREVMPKMVVRALEKLLEREGKRLKGSKVLILGRSYRAGVKEDRHAAGIMLAKLLKKRGMNVYVYDPLYSREEMEKVGFDGLDKTDEKILEEFDAVIVANDAAREYKKLLKKYSGPVLDPFGVLRR